MKIGEHVLEVEAPDLVIFRVRGELFAAEGEALGRALAERQRGGTSFILSCIESDHFGMAAEARKAFIQATRDLRLLVDAAVGANFRTRVLGRLVETAARVTGGVSLRLVFFDDERSARAWLGSQGCVACQVSSMPDNGTLPR